MILTVNGGYFLKQHQSVDLCNGEVLCFLCGTEWIIKYYLDEPRLQRVKLKGQRAAMVEITQLTTNKCGF
jgi:hypothetical protein